MSISKASAIGGVSGNFWRAAGIYISPDRTHSRVFMNLYTSQAAFASGAAPLYQQDFLMTGSAHAFTDLALNNLSDAKLIATEATFSGGTAVTGV